MKKLLLLFGFLASCLSVNAMERSWEFSDGLQPLVWAEVVHKAELLKKNAASAQRVENAIVAAKLTGLAAFFCWLCYVLPPPDNGVTIKQETTVQLDAPKGVQGGILKTTIGGLWGATNVVATAFFTTILYWLGGIVKDSGMAFASALGVVCDKQVHKVEKYYDIAMELIKSAVASAHDYDALADPDKKMKQQEMIETNIILLLQAIEITLARMILEVSIVRKHSKLSANAAFKVVHEIFEITNQNVAVINIRFQRQEGVCDVLDRWAAQLKKQGDRFKLFAWSTDY